MPRVKRRAITPGKSVPQSLTPIITWHYEPDMERQIKALRIFLGMPAPSTPPVDARLAS